MKALAFVVLAACADAPMTIDELPCPPGGTQLTYDNFGEQFFAERCDRCRVPYR